MIKRIVLILFTLYLVTSCVTLPPKEKEEPKETVKTNAPLDTTTQGEKEFLTMLEGVTIRVLKTPYDKKGTTIYKGQVFSVPYLLEVKKQGSPMPLFKLTLEYPALRDDDVLTIKSVEVTTDEKGMAEWMPSPSSISVKDFILIYPSPISSSPKVMQAVSNLSVRSSYIVKSDYAASPGGILYIFDIDSEGRPVKNNFHLLKELRNAGVNAGNAPISEATYLNEDYNILYKLCKKIAGSTSSFLIIGTFKDLSKTDTVGEVINKGEEEKGKEEEGRGEIKTTIKAEITCISMIDGKRLYSTVAVKSMLGKEGVKAMEECMEKVAKEISNKVLYGM